VEVVAAAEKRLAGRIRIDSVVPDYYARFPKACMGGWGRRLMLINPSGKVLPCHAAEVIPDMAFENAREKSLEFIWQQSSSFQRFRADDFGGCRCQALLLTGDTTATDPVCSLAPAHPIVEEALAEANSSAAVSQPVSASSFVQLQLCAVELWSYRTNPE
jgi:pyrroloquinoline quinone biosynthesis protein E